MKHKYFLIGLYITCILLSCGPKITYLKFREPMKPKNNEYDVKVYHEPDISPANSFPIGVIRIDDSGLTTVCGLDDVIELATEKARIVGADAMYITEIFPPDKSSTCYRIEAVLLGLKDISGWPIISKSEPQIRQYLDNLTKD